MTSHPIPALARTAFELVATEHRRALTLLANQTVEAMGLPADQPWHVDFQAGVVTREDTPE